MEQAGEDWHWVITHTYRTDVYPITDTHIVDVFRGRWGTSCVARFGRPEDLAPPVTTPVRYRPFEVNLTRSREFYNNSSDSDD
jgi:hypothetical protein